MEHTTEPEDNAADDDTAEDHDAWMPRLFAIALALEPGDDDEAVYCNEVLAWGLAFSDHAMTYDRDPETHFHDLRTADSAGSVLRSLSRRVPKPLRLVWM
ncbi:MAG TPA: hypothetical protein VG317_06855 [Pseudonocardiaceae bacterium]|jgi:hypothetical protein|nr:hypothetical protein [Pseudonocardiaceae bacterium]